jgi:hypothetical protein
MSQLAAEGPAHPSSILTMNWNGYIMERYLVELDGDQIELLSGMVREAIKVADEKKVPELQALLSALGTMSWKAGKLESWRPKDRLKEAWLRFSGSS